MKRTVIFAAILALVLASSAMAYDFGAFTMDVPAGWTASVDDSTGIVVKNDKTASFSITITPAEGNPAEIFVNAFVEEFKKSFAKVGAPKKQADGSYEWEMESANGVKSTAMLAVEDDKCKLVVMTGLEAAGDEIANMLGSIKEK